MITRPLMRPLVGLVCALAIALAAVLALVPPGLGRPAAHVSSDPLSDIAVYRPPGQPAGLAILVAEGGAREGPDRALAVRLVGEGLVVLPVDLNSWRTALDTQDGTCIYLGSAIEGLAKEAQRALGLDRYFHPVVVGRGEAGTLAFAAVADAPAATMAGGIAWDAAPALRTRLPVCEGATATPAPGGGFSYARTAGLPAPFVDLASGDDASPALDISESGPFTAQTAVVSDVRGAAQAIAAVAAADADALPVVDLPPKGAPIGVAVFFSGDGGWRDLDKTLGEAMQAAGVHVVGVDSLRYFWAQRDPAAMAQDLAAMFAHAGTPDGVPLAVLGYSFGADTLPFALARIDPALMRRIDLVTLLAPGRATGFQISVGGWLGFDTGEAAVVPAIAALPADKLLCVYGREEAESACTDPALAGVSRLELGGGHHFDGDYAALARRLLAALEAGPEAALAPLPGS